MCFKKSGRKVTWVSPPCKWAGWTRPSVRLSLRAMPQDLRDLRAKGLFHLVFLRWDWCALNWNDFQAPGILEPERVFEDFWPQWDHFADKRTEVPGGYCISLRSTTGWLQSKPRAQAPNRLLSSSPSPAISSFPPAFLFLSLLSVWNSFHSNHNCSHPGMWHCLTVKVEKVGGCTGENVMDRACPLGNVSLKATVCFSHHPRPPTPGTLKYCPLERREIFPLLFRESDWGQGSRLFHFCLKAMKWLPMSLI